MPLGRSKNQEQAIEEHQQRQEESRAILQGLQGPDEHNPHDKAQLIEELTRSDLTAPNGDAALANLITKDIPSANFSEEESTEFRGYVDVAILKKRARHPHEGQDVTGVLREWVHDDPNAGLQPIDKGDLLGDETFGQAVKARVSKGRQGTLLRTTLASIKESVVRREGSSEGSGRILSRIRN